jgi:hypothetical protein
LDEAMLFITVVGRLLQVCCGGRVDKLVVVIMRKRLEKFEDIDTWPPFPGFAMVWPLFDDDP